MIDISMAGASVTIVAKDKTSLTITEFSDEGNPIEIPDMDIADGNMNLNGLLVTWTKAQAAEVNISVIPNSRSDRQLCNFLRKRAIGGRGAIAEAFISNLTINVPANSSVSATGEKGVTQYAFYNGRMRRGSPAIGSNAEGKMPARTYVFIFEKIQTEMSD